jgi:hypothetical protein
MFKHWCKQQGFCRSGSNLSHVLMDGGVLSVPFDRLNDFYEAYIDSVKRGEKIYVVEQKTDRFHFFVDLDYKSVEQVSFDTIEEICTTICDRVSKFTDKKALVSVAQPKKCGDLTKYGVHINWHGFVVDHGSSMALHSHIVSALNLIFPSIDWKDVVDTSVYGGGKKNAKGSGFRMPWSHKRAKHDACNGLGCEGCEKGKVTQGQYIPILMYDGKFERIHDREPSVDILHMATLRTEATDHVVIQGSVREEGSFTVQEMKDTFNDPEVLLSLQKFIQKYMEGQEKSEVTKVYVHGDIHLVSTNSKYCENLKRRHASNHVWFLIDGDSIRQKCFCKCETTKGRINGFCKDFSGRALRLPDDVYKAMYPMGNPKKPMFVMSPVKPKTDDIVDTVNAYINKHITACDVKSITKKHKTYTAHTTLTCGTCEKTEVPFTISMTKKEKYIQQKCSCNTRKFTPTDKIISIL